MSIKTKPLTPTAPTAPTAPKVNLGNLNGSLIYTATGKVARAGHNANRHKSLNGKTVLAALTTRLVNAADIKYDVAKGFITLEPAAK
jgi:hypothetical protein